MKFRIDAKKFVGMINSCAKVVGMGSQIDFVLVKVKEGSMQVCFTDSSTQYTKKVEAESSEEGMFVVKFDKLTSIATDATASGKVEVNPVEIEVDMDEKRLRAVVSKYITMNDEAKEVSSTEHTVIVEAVGDTRKHDIFKRVDFEALMDVEGGDTWSIADFKKDVSLLTNNEDKKVPLAFSGKDKKAKAVNAQFVSITACDCVNANGFIVTAGTASVVAEIASKFENDTMVVVSDKEVGTVRFISENADEVLQVVMAKMTTAHAKAFEMYMSAEIEDINMIIHRGALQSALATVANTNANEKTKVKIVKTGEDEYALNIKTTGGQNSVVTDTNIAIERIEAGEGVEVENFEAIVLMKVFKQLLSKCENDWLMWRINAKENLFSKIIDAETDENGNTTARATYYLTLLKDE